MRRGLVFALALAACDATDPLYCGKHPADLENCPRAGCFGVLALDLVACETTPNAMPPPLAIGTNTVFDTSSGTSTPATPGLACAPLDMSSAPVCLVHGSTITIVNGAKLQVTGARPLVLVATGAIDVAGALDVASHIGGAVGAGANADCVAGTAATAAGGGAGGSFRDLGGNGGNQLGAGGAAIAAPALAVAGAKLHGGCPGSPGAGVVLQSNGGGGGGAVALIAASIAIAGTIDASGAAGGGGHFGGAGGGGSGGTIALSAPALTLASAASIFANGGAGGGGATTNDGAPGTDPVGPSSGGTGGAGADGNIGGAGAAGFPSKTRTGGDSMYIPGTLPPIGGGGGAGGGAGGFVLVHGGSLGGTNISPPPVSK